MRGRVSHPFLFLCLFLYPSSESAHLLFGAALGAWLLGERFGPLRWVAVLMVAGSVAAMRFV